MRPSFYERTPFEGNICFLINITLHNRNDYIFLGSEVWMSSSLNLVILLTLQVHQQSTHLCLRPHTCPICHKTFSIKANLERHLFVHSNHKTFECPVCSKRFSQPQTLKMHLVSHNDVKPFQCNICGKVINK